MSSLVSLLKFYVKALEGRVVLAPVAERLLQKLREIKPSALDITLDNVVIVEAAEVTKMAKAPNHKKLVLMRCLQSNQVYISFDILNKHSSSIPGNFLPLCDHRVSSFLCNGFNMLTYTALLNRNNMAIVRLVSMLVRFLAAQLVLPRNVKDDSQEPLSRMWEELPSLKAAETLLDTLIYNIYLVRSDKGVPAAAAISKTYPRFPWWPSLMVKEIRDSKDAMFVFYLASNKKKLKQQEIAIRVEQNNRLTAAIGNTVLMKFSPQSFQNSDHFMLSFMKAFYVLAKTQLSKAK